MTKDQLHTDEYSLYNSDAMEILPALKDQSIDLGFYSPPFANLYTYSSSERDMSNVDSIDQFLQQYEYVVKEMARITKKGRINAIHITDICDVSGTLSDFPSKIIELHLKHGFEYKSRVTVGKEPLKVKIRTMVQSLMHKYIVLDSTRCFPANPDYILIFRKKGICEIPVEHKCGMQNYAGETLILPHMLKAWNNANKTTFTETELESLLKSEEVDNKITKLNYYIWQRYANPIWDDIREGELLSFKDSKNEDDEKHVTPTQLDVIDRITELYSNVGEVVLSPFVGVGSDIYCPVSMGRKGIGIELKESYFKQSIKNLMTVKSRFKQDLQQKLF